MGKYRKNVRKDSESSEKQKGWHITSRWVKRAKAKMVRGVLGTGNGDIKQVKGEKDVSLSESVPFCCTIQG